MLRRQAQLQSITSHAVGNGLFVRLVRAQRGRQVVVRLVRAQRGQQIVVWRTSARQAAGGRLLCG